AGARRLADRRLIHFEHAIDVLDPLQGAAADEVAVALRFLFLASVRVTDKMLHVRVEHVASNGGLARPGHTGDHDETAQRHAHVSLAHVVQLDAIELQGWRTRIDGAVRLGRVLQRCPQEATGDRARIADEVVHLALADDLATAYSRGRAEID